MDPVTLVEEVVPVAGRELRVLRPRDAEALLDEEAFEHEEFLPYWAELWPSALALARAVGVRALRGAAHARAGLRARAARDRGRARRRAGAGHRLVARRGRAARRATPRATARRVETLVCSWTAPAPLVDARPVGPRARLRRALRGAQRRGAAAAAAAPARAARRGLARRPRPPGRGALPRPTPRSVFEIVRRAAPEVPQGGVYRMRLRR